MVIVGQGSLTFEALGEWGRLPEGWSYTFVPAVATDSQDNLFVFNRGEHPVIVLDREGNFLRAWGEGVFKTPHGMCIGPDDSVYLVDAGNHTVRKFTPEGRLLMTLGTEDVPGVKGNPFNKPTDVAVAPDGSIYVSDGYGNSRVHRFAPDGRHLTSWGSPGAEPGEFNLPHSVAVAPDGRVFVADRENHRIQIFTPEGRFLEVWEGLRQPADVFIDRRGIVYVAELQARVSIYDLKGNLLARWGGEPSKETGGFVAPHGLCVDSRGDLYVGEVLQGQRLQKFARRGG